MKSSIKRIFVLTKRNLLEIIRDPLSIIFTILLPLVMEILFYVLFHKLTPQFEMQYLAPGIVVFSEAFLTLFTGMLLSMDKNTSFLKRLFVTKTRSFEFILSYMLAVLPITIVQSILFFGVGLIIDSALFSIRIIIAVIISIITSLLFIAFGLFFGSFATEKSIGGLSSIIIVGQSVLSGMWFPLNGMDEVVIKIMDVLPFRNATILMQNLIIGINDLTLDFIKPLLIVLIYTLIIGIISIITFKKKMKE